MLRIQALNSSHAPALRVRHFSYINLPKRTTSNIVLLKVEVVGSQCYLLQRDFKILKLLPEYLHICRSHSSY
ncbi:hypothetical protein HanIR_Chr13g0652431 [Helianthus annuus]|nr:hypothetical protein HanIR_Chr13g0652431 [Helianthus annuus]